MLFVLTDRKYPGSFFKPYYDILPPKLGNMPISWTQEQLDLLKGSFLVPQIKERRSAIEEDYSSICAIAPELKELCNLEEFKWARMMVCSRNFGIVVNGLRTAALVPYADMLNHKRPRESKWQFDDMVQSFTISSIQDMSVGAEVFDSYGQKCNHRFLLNYGFSVEDNVENDGYCPNEYPFVVSLKSDDALFEEKAAVLRREGGSGTSRRIRVSVGDMDTFKVFLALLRLVTMDEADYSSCVPAGIQSLREATMPFSVKNEAAAMNLLKSKCISALDAYPTSYDDDVGRLDGSKPILKEGETVDPVCVMYTNERHALLQLRGEKEILGHFLALSELALDLLTSGCDETELEQIIKERLKGRVDDQIYQYCRGTVLRVVRAEVRKLSLDAVAAEAEALAASHATQDGTASVVPV